MKIQNYYLAILLCLALFACKKDHSDSSGEGSGELAYQSFLTLNSVAKRFVVIGDSMQVTPPVALYYTSLWAQKQPGVLEAHTLDSAYLIITTTGGYSSSLTLNEIKADGSSVYRGGGNGGSGRLSRTTASSGGKCSNKIKNKKVLLYVPFESQFYGTNFDTRVVEKIKNGDVSDVDITVLKNSDCTIDVFRTLDRYGLVIFDTHGQNDGLSTGIEFGVDSIDMPGSVDEFLTLIGTKVGVNNVQSLITHQIAIDIYFKYSPSLQVKEQWDKYKSYFSFFDYRVHVKSKGIRELVPDLSNTIVFANACYSGWTTTGFNGKGQYSDRVVKNEDPIKPAWLSRNPLAFYGYEAADGVSYKADNEYLCKPSEDTLIKSLFYDGDSTGVAHLNGGTTIIELAWSQYYFPLGDFGPLRFNHYRSPSWCYGHCGDTLVDDRDGQKYPTVCIGDQIWMAKNLNYASAGICFDNDPNACNTYGRLYTWQEVTAGVASNTSPSGVKGICPKGWHVPSLAEWQKLITNVGGENAAKSKLRAKSSLWEDGPGTDDFGFALLPSGQCETLPSYDCFNLGGEANIWTSSKEASIPNRPIYYFISEGQVAYFPQDDNVTANLSCRCVKD